MTPITDYHFQLSYIHPHKRTDNTIKYGFHELLANSIDDKFGELT